MKLALSILVLVLAAAGPGCRSTAERAAATAVSPPVILARADWNAHPPVAPMPRHTPTRITIHHTATSQNPARSLADKLRGLQQFSQREGRLASGKVKPPWPDVPYHYYVDCAGAVGEGRPVEFVGDTNTEYDPTGHALVVLEGNFEQEEITPAQMATLRHLTLWLAQQWKVPPDAIQGHKDYASTLCPGARLQTELPALRQYVAGALR